MLIIVKENLIMNDMDFVDISECENVKKNDKFMVFIYISLIVLVVR